MSNQHGDDHEDATVLGFEVRNSPDSSYNNAYLGSEDEGQDPPAVPLHPQRTLLGYPASADPHDVIPPPQNVAFNHLYIDDCEPPRSVVALGITHRFRSKFVTVVLYKPVRRRGSASA